MEASFTLQSSGSVSVSGAICPSPAGTDASYKVTDQGDGNYEAEGTLMTSGVMKMITKQSLKYQLLAAQCGFGFEILYTIFWGGWHTTCRLPRPV